MALPTSWSWVHTRYTLRWLLPGTFKPENPTASITSRKPLLGPRFGGVF